MASDRHWFTHTEPPPTTVVRFLHYRFVEVIKAKFSLECDLVICVGKVKCHRSLGPLEGGGVPSHSQQLTIVFDPTLALFASTKLDVNIVCAIGVDDEDLFKTGMRRWARCVLMTDVKRVAQI